MPVHCRKNNSTFFSDFPSGVGLTGEMQIPIDADLVAENNVGSASDSWKVLDGQERPNPTLACSFVSGFCKVCISARRSEAGLARNINRKNPNGQSVACLRLDQLAVVKAKATEHPGHILLTTYLHAVHPDSGKVTDPIEVQPHLPACIAFRKRDVPAKPSRLSSRAGFRKGIGIGIFVRPDIRIAINALAHQRARQRFHHGRRSPFAIIKTAAGKNSTGHH